MAIQIQGMTPLLQVFDMPTSLAFYCEVLGFEVFNSSAPVPHCDWAWLKLNGVDLMLNTAYEKEYRPPSPDATRTGTHDDTCLYFGCPDVDAVYAYLLSRGVDARPPKVAPYGMKQLYLRDPDGFGLCFQWLAQEQSEKCFQEARFPRRQRLMNPQRRGLVEAPAFRPVKSRQIKGALALGFSSMDSPDTTWPLRWLLSPSNRPELVNRYLRNNRRRVPGNAMPMSIASPR